MKLQLGLIGVAALALAAAGCSSGGNPVRDVFTDFGAGPPAPERADFVARSRPAELDYIPVGSARPEPRSAARTPDEIKKVEAELDAARIRNEARAAAARREGGAR